MVLLSLLSGFLCSNILIAYASPGVTYASPSKDNSIKRQTAAQPAPFCFPALGFEKPLVLPKNNTHWWCDPTTEYAFVGFSYEVTACKTPILSHAASFSPY